MIVTVLSGVSGGGKSTFIKKLKEQPVCSTDKFIDDHARQNGVNYSDSFETVQEQKLFGTITGLFYAEMTDYIKTGHDFIVDRTNLTSGSRQALTNFIKTTAESFGQEVYLKCVYIDLRKEELFKRLAKREKETGKSIPEDVIKGQIKVWEVPEISDGFNEIDGYWE